ncbi:hypothetical protein MKX01_027839, partial [Papaver californicum]
MWAIEDLRIKANLRCVSSFEALQSATKYSIKFLSKRAQLEFWIPSVGTIWAATTARPRWLVKGTMDAPPNNVKFGL